MAEQPTVKTSNSAAKRYVRLAIIVVIGVALLCIAGYYLEDVQRYVRLRGWDRGAPGRTVVTFLTAAKQGKAEEANRYVGSPDYQPLKENGKAVGYFIATPAGIMDFYFKDFVPEGEIKVSSVKFIFIAEGAAEVEALHKGGEVGKYRLKMLDGEWKITDILSGGKRRGSDEKPPSASPPEQR